MKKITIIFSLVIAATVAVFAATNWYQKEQPVNKEINLAITSNNNYSSAAYNDAKASVHVIITKRSVENVNGKGRTPSCSINSKPCF